MEYRFTNPDFDIKNLLKNDLTGINPFLLENNSKQAEHIYNFLGSKSKILVVNGFMGTGKYSITKHTLAHTDNIVLTYNCFETTILDDILLTFFEEFKQLATMGKISVPKTKAENFTQKINSYFETISKPIVVVINSFEEIIKANKSEIIGFIKHLASRANIKVIIITRVVDYDDFDFKFDKVPILALDKPIFEKYLRSENFKQIGPLSNELYKHTRGYFLYTALTIKIMKLRNLKLIDFLEGFSKSFLSFNDFILREGLSIVDPVSGHLFRFLTTMRHPVSIKLLKTLHLYNEEKATFFIDNLILSKEDDCLYLQDYYKAIAENSITGSVAIKLHQGCVDLYNTQLPLKPLERDLIISRQTMRNEIEFHSMFIPQKPMITKDITKQTEYTEYAHTAQEVKQEVTESKEEKDEKIKNMSFIFDENELGVLDTIADSIKDYMTISDKKAQQEEEENKLSLTQLMNYAKQEETKFNYKHSTELYIKALAQKNDEDYYTYLPTIYTKLAHGYQQLSDWYNAEKYCEMAQEFYESTGDMEKVYETKYTLASIFYMTFKKDFSKTVLDTIDRDSISVELRIKVLNLLASTDITHAHLYYEEALSLNHMNVDKSTLAELYYKYALCCEDREQFDQAAKYYKLCIRLKNTPYLADALANLALLYDDLGERNLAIKYYQESLKVYEATKNLNGIYSSSMKLGEIYSSSSYESAVEFYSKAIACANTMDETFYIISANTALGDLYYNKKDDEKAYKNYKTAYELTKDSKYSDNADKISNRINDIRMRVGEERFSHFE